MLPWEYGGWGGCGISGFQWEDQRKVIKRVGVRDWGSWRMWWVNYRVTDVAKSTREWVSLIFWQFYAGKMKGSVTFWALVVNFFPESLWLWQWWHWIVVCELDCCLPVDEQQLQKKGVVIDTATSSPADTPAQQYERHSLHQLHSIFAFSVGLWQWPNFLLVPGIAESRANYSYCSANKSIWR